eukprot:jgi/Mesvir1/9773/Mv12226-RA.1
MAKAYAEKKAEEQGGPKVKDVSLTTAMFGTAGRAFHAATQSKAERDEERMLERLVEEYDALLSFYLERVETATKADERAAVTSIYEKLTSVQIILAAHGLVALFQQVDLLSLTFQKDSCLFADVAGQVEKPQT